MASSSTRKRSALSAAARQGKRRQNSPTIGWHCRTSITGHAFVSINQVLRHYLATHPEMADTAIGKLLAWMEETGVAV
ncbi:hypothetical protein V5F59_06035 [Xanthobacter autotrophicus DSM 431]|uniref:hypothetical protein n=1 Tax=Xanthobacter nonsaccharivorans TaxID=3119912 RepID=UPI003728B16B